MTDAEKIKAVADYYKVSTRDIKTKNSLPLKVYVPKVDTTLLVLTTEEAADYASDAIKKRLKERNLKVFNEKTRNYIIENMLNKDFLVQIVNAERLAYYEDMDDEELVEFAIDGAYIDEEDAYDEDGEIKNTVNISKLRDKMLAQDYKYIEEDPVGYYEFVFGESILSLLDIYKQEQYMNVDEVVNYILNNSTLGEIISDDNVELYLGKDLFGYELVE